MASFIRGAAAEVIVLTIDEPTPSLNVVWSGAHWAKKVGLRRRWHWLVRAACLNGKVYEKPKYAKATVTIERYGPRLLDADNARGGAKMLCDQLVRQGLLLDDKPAVIGEPIIRQIVSKTERKTIVRIEPA
jgi:hypothetical protein